MSEVATVKVKGTEQRPVPTRPWNPFAPMVPFAHEGLFGMSPFALMREFTQELDRVFGGEHKLQAGAWFPPIECKQLEGKFVISAELPGLKKEDLKVEVADDFVILEGERKQEYKQEKEGFYRTERNYGRFYRSIALPEGAQAEQIKAELSNGVLEVTIPVSQLKAKVRQIPIEAAKT